MVNIRVLIAANEMSSKAPYICPAHMQKLRLLEVHSSFPRAQNVINAILFLDKLRRKASLKAFPRLPVSFSSHHLLSPSNIVKMLFTRNAHT